MTTIEQDRPDGVLLRLNFGDGPFYCLMPNDCRMYQDVMLSELRPWPAMDAMQMLSRVTGKTITEMTSQKGSN